MNAIKTIMKKEFLDITRDRRTLITMIILPLMLFPVLLNVMTRVSVRMAKKEKAKALQVAVIKDKTPQEFQTFLEGYENVEIVYETSEDEINDKIVNDSLDVYFMFSSDFFEKIKELGTGRIDAYYKSKSTTGIVKKRIQDILDEYKKPFMDERYAALGIEAKQLEVIELEITNMATMQEELAENVGGFIPYLFIIFCFMGAMYPAIDLAAGEKERGTYETLLTTPVSRFEILLGKFGVVTIGGLVSAIAGIVGLYIGVRMNSDIPKDLLESLISILEIKSMIIVTTLLIPLSVFFSGLLLSLSIIAKSFKEAQSIVSPLMIVVILPAVMGMLPGIELNTGTALIPILNVTLATKVVLSGNYPVVNLALVYISLSVFACAALYVSSLIFKRESSVFNKG